MFGKAKRPHDPAWDDGEGDRVRVLLECGHDSTPSIIAAVIAEEGYDVRTCTGPGDHSCSLVEHGSCELVDGADVVVNMLRPHEGGKEVLDRTTELRRPPAVVAEMTPDRIRRIERGEDPDDPGSDRVTVVQTPVTREGLVQAIRAALDQDVPVPRP